MAAKVRELVGGQAEQAVESIILATDGTLGDDTAEKRIQQRTELSDPAGTNQAIRRAHWSSIWGEPG
jgi:hypothetical protein